MNFQRGRPREEPEINLVPMIDVLLVIIIFLMLTTTYSKFSGLEINLPTADASKQAEQPNEIDVAVTASGQVLVNKSPLTATVIVFVSPALPVNVSEPEAAVDRVLGADLELNAQGLVAWLEREEKAKRS